MGKMKFLSGSTVVTLLCLTSFQAHALRVKEEQVLFDEINDYKLCITRDYSGLWCHDALKRWVKEHSDDAFKAGKMTVENSDHWLAAPFFSQAFEQNKGNCKDETVSKAVLSALALEPKGNEETIASAKNIAFKHCFEELKTKIVGAYKIDSPGFRNTCEELIKKNALSGLKKAKCSEGSKK